MTNINYEVWSALDKEPAIKRDLRRGIINVRALARFLKDKRNIKGSMDSIISAIRRYPSDGVIDINRVAVVLKETVFALKNRVVLFSIKREDNTLKLLQKIFNFIDIRQGDIIRFTEARKSIKIFVDEKNKEKVQDVIPKNKIFSMAESLTELSLNFGEKKSDTVGVIASILTQFASNNINIVESYSCFPEYMIYIMDKDSLKAHETLLHFLKGQ